MSRLSRLALNEEGFVFDPATGDSFLANHCGLFIIRALGEGRGEKDIVRALTEEYDVAAEETERDVADFREQLKALSII